MVDSTLEDMVFLTIVEPAGPDRFRRVKPPDVVAFYLEVFSRSIDVHVTRVELGLHLGHEQRVNPNAPDYHPAG